MGYTYILRLGLRFGNTFFYPHGGLFCLVPSRCLGFFRLRSGVPRSGPGSYGLVECSFHVFACVAVAGFVCVRVFGPGSIPGVWSGLVVYGVGYVIVLRGRVCTVYWYC